MIPEINGLIKKDEREVKIPINEITCYSKEFDEYVCVFQDRINSIEKYKECSLKKADEDKSFLIIRKAEIEEGGYEMKISPDSILINAKDTEGAVNGLTTLYHLVYENDGLLNCMTFRDIPDNNWRGFMIDVSRHFFEVDVIKSMIENCSLIKLNRLHLHLSDDQGYRVESDAYKKLNEIASWREKEDGSMYGGYYTKEDIRDIIDYAKKRGIEIIPEIDLPGHTLAIIAAYPFLSCKKDKVKVSNKFGVHKKVLCAGDDRVLEFVYDILDEVANLFPFEYFHIGGDEVPKEEWENCKACKEKISKEGLSNEEELQAWFTNKLIDYLKSKNKKVIGWNEILKSDKLDKDATLQYWSEEEDNYINLDNLNNREVIYSSTRNLYFDYPYYILPLREAFNIRPIVKNNNQIPKKNLLGYEAELWSERIPDKKKLEQMAYPRLFATSEKCWRQKSNYTKFIENLKIELEKLKKRSINYTPLQISDPNENEIYEHLINIWKVGIKEAKKSNDDKYIYMVERQIKTYITNLLPKEKIEKLLSILIDT